MLAMPKIVLESRGHDFWTNLSKTNFRWLQAHMVRFGFEIASIFSPFYDRDCKHIRSPSESRLQPCLVPIVTILASIFGPSLYMYFPYKMGDIEYVFQHEKANLQKLKRLDLRHNKIEGNLPNVIYQMSSIVQLFLNFNKISQIQPGIANLNQLVNLDLR